MSHAKTYRHRTYSCTLTNNTYHITIQTYATAKIKTCRYNLYLCRRKEIQQVGGVHASKIDVIFVHN